MRWVRCMHQQRARPPLPFRPHLAHSPARRGGSQSESQNFICRWIGVAKCLARCTTAEPSACRGTVQRRVASTQSEHTFYAAFRLVSRAFVSSSLALSLSFSASPFPFVRMSLSMNDNNNFVCESFQLA